MPPKRKPSVSPEPWICRNGRASIAPPAPEILTVLPALDLVAFEDRRIFARREAPRSNRRSASEAACPWPRRDRRRPGDGRCKPLGAGRRCRASDRRGRGCRARRRARPPRHREAAGEDRARCRPTPPFGLRRRLRSTSSAQRRRRFLGSAGSHAPQWLPTRGTPPDVPQPRMVSFRVMRRFAAPSSRRAAPY